MSDLTQCIANGLAEGALTPEQAAEARDTYQTLFDGLEGVVRPDEQARLAAKQTFDKLEREAMERKRQARLTQSAIARLDQEMESYAGRDKPAALLAYFHDDGFAQYTNIRDRKLAVQGIIAAEMGEMQLDFMRGIFGGQRNKKLLDQTVDEIFGTPTGNGKASDYAQRWYKAAEILRTMFNNAGGHIGKLDGWGLPTRHNGEAFRKTTFAQWREFVEPKLNREKMIDRGTDLPLTDLQMEIALRNMFEAVRTNGWSRKNPSAGGGGSAIANRRAEERFLIFKDGPSWRAYQEVFGEGNSYHVMLDHMEGMATDIAAMQTFGPNPNAVIKYLGDVVQKAAAGDDKAMRRARSKAKLSETMYRHYTGAVNDPLNTTAADLGTATRSYLTGTFLGGTTIVAAPTDFINQALARRYAGMSVTRQISQLIGQLNPASRADRVRALEAGIVNQHIISQGLAALKYTGDAGVDGARGTRTGRMARIANSYADAALRLNGLSQITQSARTAMGIEWQQGLAKKVSQSFDDLDEPTQNILRKSGLAEDWDIIRRAPLDQNADTALLNVSSLSRLDLPDRQKTELIVKYLAGMNAQIEYGTPTGSLRSRQFLQDQSRPGALAGEIVKSTMMFKSFPVAITYMHIARFAAARAQYGVLPASAYLGVMATAYMMGGVLALQLGQIALGRDPLDMTDPQFWGSAMLKGGGLGYFGDLLANADPEYGASGIDTAGPVASAVQDVGALTVGNVIEAAKGEDTNLGRDVVKFGRDYTPFGRTFYARLAKDRLIFDQLQEALDPQASAQFRRRVRHARRENDQGYYWAPGHTAPSRAPDLSEAVPD